jgi:hypothetical protein
MSANIRHASEQPKWGTNPLVIDIGHAVLTCAGLGGQITVDPFSEPEFNAHVRANHILTGAKGNDGFKDRWLPIDGCPRADHILADYPIASTELLHLATAMVNPPGDELGDNVKNAWRLVDRYHELGWLGGGVLWVAFNLNQMQTLQGISARHPLHGDFEGLRCVPDTRLPFTAHSTRPATRVNKRGEVIENDDAPSHPCFFFLLPSSNDVIAAEQRRLFESMSSKLGAVF